MNLRDSYENSSSLAIRRVRPYVAPAARASAQGCPYKCVSTDMPTAIFIRCAEPQDHGNVVVRFSWLRLGCVVLLRRKSFATPQGFLRPPGSARILRAGSRTLKAPPCGTLPGTTTSEFSESLR